MEWKEKENYDKTKSMIIILKECKPANKLSKSIKDYFGFDSSNENSISR